jgi:hypothetical protein
VKTHAPASRLLASLALGAAAGVIDVIPMIPLGTDLAAKAAAFLHWLVLGFVITYVRLDVAGWLKGLIVGLASGVPVAATLAGADPRSVPPVLVMSALLGVGVGWVTGRVAVLRGPDEAPRALPRPD